MGVVKLVLASVGVMRPDHCPACARAAYSAEGRVNVQGHGVVERHQRGPARPGEPGENARAPIRRYRCVPCGAVIRVVPSAAVARKHFSGAAIALSLALWGLSGLSAAEVRAIVNDRETDGESGWASLIRWAREIAEGTLFPELGLRGVAGTARELAAKAASALCGWAPTTARESPRDHQAFAGACHVR